VSVPVADLKCGRDQMDRSLRAALKADHSTRVAYIVATFGALSAESADSSIVHTAGTVTLAERTNSVRMDLITMRRVEGGVAAEGELPILMSDYGVKPPTAMFGLVRAADRVVVKFALTLGPETVAAVTALCASASRQ
jgi:polyisoprenoid-binding protein YceI